MRYFFYGSLTDPDVLGVVLGRRPELASASLEGWRRLRVAGESYPLIVPAAGERVDGSVADMRPADARRLAWYEGDDYLQAGQTVRLATGGTARARLFLPKPELAHANEAWDAAAWARTEKPALLEAARRWMAFEARQPANLDAAWRAAKAPAPR